MLYELIAVVRPGNLAEVKEYVLLLKANSQNWFLITSLRDWFIMHIFWSITTRGYVLTWPRIARTAGSLILRNGGTIRALKNWGVWSLPSKTRKHQAQYSDGHYFIMRYDASSRVQQDVRMTLGLDPRMIKFASVKLGDGTLASISKYGDISWNDDQGPWRRRVGLSVL